MLYININLFCFNRLKNIPSKQILITDTDNFTQHKDIEVGINIHNINLLNFSDSDLFSDKIIYVHFESNLFLKLIDFIKKIKPKNSSFVISNIFSLDPAGCNFNYDSISMQGFIYKFLQILDQIDIDSYKSILRSRVANKIDLNYEAIFQSYLVDFNKSAFIMNDYIKAFNNLDFLNLKSIENLLDILYLMEKLNNYCKFLLPEECYVLHGCMGWNDIKLLAKKFDKKIGFDNFDNLTIKQMEQALFTLNFLNGAGFSNEEIDFKKNKLLEIIDLVKENKLSIYDYFFDGSSIIFSTKDNIYLNVESEILKKIIIFNDDFPIYDLVRMNNLDSISFETKNYLIKSLNCNNSWYANLIKGLIHLSFKEYIKAKDYLLLAYDFYPHWRISWLLYLTFKEMNIINNSNYYLNKIPKNIKEYLTSLE